MKKNGRLVAIALGSVLCASCVGGAFLVAGSTPAAETVRAANQIDYNYSHTFSTSDNSLFKNGASKNLDGVEWTWKGNTPGSFGMTNGQYQIGSRKSVFAGGTLSTDLSKSEFGTEINGIRVYTASKSGSVKVTIKIGEDVLVEQKTVSWTNIDWITWESDVALTGPISIEFGSSTEAFYLGKIEISSFADPVIDHIEIAGEPRKEYGLGEDFDISGLFVLAYDSPDDENPEDVTSDVQFNVTLPDGFKTAAGSYTVTVEASYLGLSASVVYDDIIVVDKELVSLVISGDLTKKNYTKGDAIEPDGLIITAHYSDGSDAVLSSGYELQFDYETLDYTYITAVKVFASVGEISSDQFTITDINVVPASKYIKATKNSDIYDGAKMIVANSSGEAMANYISGNNIKVSTSSTEMRGDELFITSDLGDIGFVTLEQEGEYYYLTQFVDGEKIYLTATSTSKNNLQGKAEKSDNALFGISVSSNGVITTSNKGNSKKYLLQYNSQSSLFSVYGGGQDPVYFYVLSTGDIDLDANAEAFRDSMLTGIACNPNGTSAPDKGQWEQAKSNYLKMLDYHKNYFGNAQANPNGNVFEQVAAKYDYIVGKYGSDEYEDFMSRNPSPVQGALLGHGSIEYDSIIAVAALALIGAAAGTIMIASRRRKAK